MSAGLTKIMFLGLFFLGSCSSESEIVKVGAAAQEENLNSQNAEAQAEPSDAASEPEETQIEVEVSDWLAETEMAEVNEAVDEIIDESVDEIIDESVDEIIEAIIDETVVEESTENSGTGIESPIMVTGAYLLGCVEIEENIECEAELESGFNLNSLEVFDLDGVLIPREQLEFTFIEEGEVSKLIIRIKPLAQDPEPELALEPKIGEPDPMMEPEPKMEPDPMMEPEPVMEAAISAQEACEMQEGFVWKAETNECLEFALLSAEEQCFFTTDFYWSTDDQLCIENGTVFGFVISTVNVNTNLPLGAEPIDVSFELNQSEYIRYVDVFSDWWAKRPTDIKIYHLVNGAKGDLIAEQNFPTKDDQICGVDFQSPCTLPDGPVSRLTVELDKLYYVDSVIVEVGGLLSDSQGYAIIKDVSLRN